MLGDTGTSTFVFIACADPDDDPFDPETQRTVGQLLRQIDFNRVPYEREFVVYRFATNVLYLLLGWSVQATDVGRHPSRLAPLRAGTQAAQARRIRSS